MAERNYWLFPKNISVIRKKEEYGGEIQGLFSFSKEH